MKQDKYEKAMRILCQMVETAEEIQFNLNFEQLITYNLVLIHPSHQNQSHVLPIFHYEPSLNLQLQEHIDWLLNCLKFMQDRNFRQKQIVICEAQVALAYFKIE